jgi:hypothetical protein
MYSFERKARFYERRHEGKADRLIVVSPMIEPKALKVARDLGKVSPLATGVMAPGHIIESSGERRRRCRRPERRSAERRQSLTGVALFGILGVG